MIARVPFDEGSLTGGLSKDSTWPEGDFRNNYFTPENLAATLERVEKIGALVPPGETLPGLAMRFVLSNPDVTVVIPGHAPAEECAGQYRGHLGVAGPPDRRIAQASLGPFAALAVIRPD